MERVELCIGLTLGSALLTLGAGECPTGTYRDTVTGNCDPCSDICEHMKQQGTEESCRSHCPLEYGTLDENLKGQSYPGSSVVYIVVPLSAVVAVLVISITFFLIRRRSRPPSHRPAVPPAPAQTALEGIPLCSIPTECTEQCEIESSVPSKVEMTPDCDVPRAYPDLPIDANYYMSESYPFRSEVV